jgi:sulfate adenylyltransferase
LVRKHLSSELGFSKEHRDINIRRIGYVASEVTKNGGIANCAPIAPYDATRKEIRAMIEPVGGFILVHLSISVDVCERRDRKRLYAKARAGILKEFTGISDPYEEPRDAEVRINTAELSAAEAAQGNHPSPGARRLHRDEPQQRLTNIAVEHDLLLRGR